MEISIHPNAGVPVPPQPLATDERLVSGFVPDMASAWTDAELENAVLGLCDGTPPAGMLACWRAVEHCRRQTPRGTRASLLMEMRDALRLDAEKQLILCAAG